MEKRWYCASFNAVDSEGNVNIDISVDNCFFSAENDDAAIEYAKEYASYGENYLDIGYVDTELVAVTRVDPNNEWEDVETIWF